MLCHGVEQFILADVIGVQTEFAKERLLASYDAANRYIHVVDERSEGTARQGRLQIFEDARLVTRGADGRERIARGAAVGIVINGDLHADR